MRLGMSIMLAKQLTISLRKKVVMLLNSLTALCLATVTNKRRIMDFGRLYIQLIFTLAHQMV